MNDLLKFGISKNLMKEKLKEIHLLVDKIDSYTAFEYFTGVISEEEFNSLKEQYLPKKSTPVKKKSEVEGFKPMPNPEKLCVFKGNSPRDRCIYCNSIRKYIQGKECPKYNEEILGSTVSENNESDA